MNPDKIGERFLSLAAEAQRLERSGFRGCLELHFPGNGGAFKPVIKMAIQSFEPGLNKKSLTASYSSGKSSID